MQRKYGLDLAAAAVLLVIAAIAWQQRSTTPDSAAITSLAPCSLTAATCVVRLPSGQSLALSLEPAEIRPLQPFTIRARLAVDTPSAIEVRFRGEDMAMGEVATRLIPQAPGEFTGQATLPVCVTGRMRWRMTLLIRDGGAEVAVPFLFSSER